ncbi:MAG: hypothetical protein ACRDL0_17300, partial [Thermoleophilaceae bacterium]
GCTDRDLLDWRAAGGRWDYRLPAAIADHPAAAGLARLAADPAAARAMGDRGRARQRERFGGEAMGDAYLRALEEVATR